MNNSVEIIKRSKYTNKFNKYGAITLMALPGIFYFLINNYLPMFGLVVAFKNINYVDGIFKSPWVGFKNFEFLFKTPDAFIITRNTLAYNIVFIFFNLFLSVSLAILLNEIASSKLYRFYQSTFIIPFMVSFTVVGYIVYAFLSPEHGFMNSTVLHALGINSVDWYMEPKYWPVILVLVNSWKYVGYLCVIYLAAIIGVDTEYYEAAIIDGAGRWDKIRYITVPMIKPVIITMTLLQIGRIFYGDFGLFFQIPLNIGLLYPVTDVIDTYVYRSMLTTGEIGMASAAGFYQSIVGFVIVLLSNMLVRKISKENALF